MSDNFQKQVQSGSSASGRVGGAILVTGGTGYIGSHTVVDLLNNNFDVVSIDSNIRSKPVTVSRIESITGKRIANYPIDLCNKEAVRKVFQESNFSGIIHFAALKSVPESVEKPLLYYRNNLISLINLLELADEFGVRDFVFSSSCSVYGNTSDLPVTENTPFAPAESPYAHTKQIGEEIIRAHSKISKGKFVLLRYFNPVGAHESGKLGEDTTDVITAVVPRITGTAMGKYPQFTVFGNDYDTRDGTCVRDYIHVMDIANAHTKAVQYLQNDMQQQAVEVFNLGTGNGVTVLEAIQSFERVSGKKLNYRLGERRAGDVISIYANNEKARTMLGWNIERNLDTMMHTAWQWEQQLANE
ncbi:MAG: UDP-glucose 4-epimerase GalE [Chitinophagales bacterium]|nr:UDP-glucose 4-epimerase GalE [Chitinophagales bacterium]